MTNPPAAVKLALESICLMLGEETSDWKKIRQVIIRDNFISSIVNFSSEEMRYQCQNVCLVLNGSPNDINQSVQQSSGTCEQNLNLGFISIHFVKSRW